VNELSSEKIEELKAKFPDRELHRIELVDGNEASHVLVMTGPNRDEYRKFVSDVQRASDSKPADKLEAIRFAIEQNALAQIRWPDRDDVKALFSSLPAMVEKFADKLHETAGGTIELRSKKL
jgi:hypothetical protein